MSISICLVRRRWTGLAGHIDDANIVAVDHHGQGYQDVKFLKKLPHLAALGHDLRNGTVFCLSTGAGNRGLAFGGPRH
jgi:hypothetical protein